MSDEPMDDAPAPSADARILVASDKFKGTYSSAEVGSAVAEGLAEAGLPCRVIPVADGGEGTARVLLSALGGSVVSTIVHDSQGRAVTAEFVVLGQGQTAVVEAAQAVGLWRHAESELDPWNASSFGAGELIAAAAATGAQEVIVAPGGTATVDGGAGAIAALRDLAHLPRLRVACDVRTSWEDAAATFAPQKGADAAMASALGERLSALAADLRKDPRGRALTGCGGGLSGALWAEFDAELVLGADYVLDAIDFDRLIGAATLVITGEGRIDEQTTQGKLVASVAERCRRSGVECVAVVGQDALGDAGGQRLGLAQIREARTLDELRAFGNALGSALHG